jgi:UDP-N-acetylmuramyl pentapeptide synthase
MQKRFLEKFLAFATRLTLSRYHPTIIAVTGSVGKTSTKDAVACVLSSRFRVRASKRNLNTEFGLPLTVLGEEDPHGSRVEWIKVLFHILPKLLTWNRRYPTHLVLEFAADKPGDISRLLSLAHPIVGVVTRLSPVHVSNYPSFEDLVREKTDLVRAIPPGGLVVLNADEENVLEMRGQAKAGVMTYGFGPEAELDGEGYTLDTQPAGDLFVKTRFTAQNRKTSETVSVELLNTIGIHQAYNALAALAVGLFFGVPLMEGAKALLAFQAPPGRLKPLRGIKNSLLLDDSYNAAPASTKAALQVLSEFSIMENAHRVAILGWMAELGNLSEEEHRQIGWKAAEVGVDFLVCVGEMARDIARGAIEAGLEKEKVVEVKDAKEAGRFMDGNIRPGDVVLIKGSQSARMEFVTKDLMAEPGRAEELLIRQTREWS